MSIHAAAYREPVKGLRNTYSTDTKKLYMLTLMRQMTASHHKKNDGRPAQERTAEARNPARSEIVRYVIQATGFAVALAVAAFPSLTTARTAHSGGTLNIVTYSTPGPVYSGPLAAAFAKTKAGKHVSLSVSPGPSDSQSQAVANGQPADVVNFSYAPNIQTLVGKHLVPKSWDRNPYHGNVTDSVVAFGVRQRNPKHIKNWSDLLKKGIQVLTPNPQASGGAKWNLLAAYGAQRETRRSKKQAVGYLKKLFKHVSVQDTSASHELNTFLNGTGDVMIGYEDDIMEAQQKMPGKIKLVVPKQSLLIENPISWTLKPAAHNARLAKKFVSFLYSKRAQTIWAKAFYWPVVKSVARHHHFPRPKKLFNIRQLGGWPKLDPEFFGPNGIVTKIEQGG